MREKRKKTKKGLVHGYAMYKVITTQVVQTFTVILLATQNLIRLTFITLCSITNK